MNIAVVLALCACGDPSRAAPSPARQRDSSGIVVVENSLGNVVSWTIDSTPALMVGASSERDRFTRVVGAVFLRNGGVLIADSGEVSVRLFDSTGRFVQTVVGKGGGPTEMNAVKSLFSTTADTIYATDGRAIVVIDPDGRPVRKIANFDFRPDSLKRNSQGPVIVGVHDDGSIVTKEGKLIYRTDEAVEPRHFTWSIPKGKMFRRGMPAGDLLAHYDEPPVALEKRDDGRTVMYSPEVALAVGDELFYAAGDTLGFLVYAKAGHLKRIVRVARPRIPVANWSDLKAKGSTMGTGLPPYVPDVVHFIRDDSKRLWVSSVNAEGNLSWYVFSSDGVLEMEVHSQRPIGILAVRGDRVLGLYSGTDDVPQIAIYRLRK